MDPGRKSFHINLTTTVSEVKQITISGHLEPLKSHFLYLYKVKTRATAFREELLYVVTKPMCLYIKLGPFQSANLSNFEPHTMQV